MFATSLALTPALLAGEPTVEYILDDGTGNVNVGPPSSFDADMLWGNYFQAAEGGELIVELKVSLGTSYPLDDFDNPVPLTLYLFEDPDDDGDPTNAIPVASLSFVPTVFSQTDFNIVAIEPTLVEGGFFVAANVFADGGVDRPARLDPQPVGGENAWLFYDEEINPDDLASSPFFTTMDNPEFVPIFGVWMIRAVGQPKPLCADLNDSGTVDLADLNIVLANFGAGDGGDINGDGETHLADLNALLATFGQACL
ncbi:MAG: hypothetical protein ACF8MJ_08190 [Phycisphaerales bacterium JB050]